MAKVTMREPRVPGAVQQGNDPAAVVSATKLSAAPELKVAAERFNVGEIVTMKDVRGRTLQIKKLSLMEEMDLLACAGAENAANGRWMLYATLVACVRGIDGEQQGPLATSRLLRARVQFVGEAGVELVSQIIAAGRPANDDGDAGEPDVWASAKN